MCVFAVVCVCVCVPWSICFCEENTKWHPSHYFIPSNYAALLWHVSAREIAPSDIWCHNKKASITIDYQSSQQRRGFIFCHFHPAPDTFPALVNEKNLLCEALRWIGHNTSSGHRNTKNKSATGTPAFSWSSSGWLWWLGISRAQMVQETKSQLQRSHHCFHVCFRQFAEMTLGCILVVDALKYLIKNQVRVKVF